jgi:hypothetical protein
VSESKRIIGYALVPVHAPDPGMIMTAALMECPITGKMLSSMGGGGSPNEIVAPEVVEKMFSDEGKRFFNGE